VVRESKIVAQRYKSGLHIHKATINLNSDKIIMNEYIIYIITEGFWGFGVNGQGYLHPLTYILILGS
jgi:hypothetical protein